MALPRSKLTQKPNAGCAPGPGKEVQTTHAGIFPRCCNLLPIPRRKCAFPLFQQDAIACTK
jgi:hypothetical protein